MVGNSEERQQSLTRSMIDAAYAATQDEHCPSLTRSMIGAAMIYRPGDGESLLNTASLVLEVLAQLAPETKNLCDDFRTAWHRYSQAECKTLDEAFDTKRPKNWRKSRAAFAAKNAVPILLKVTRLRISGASVPGVFDEVGIEFGRSGKAVEKLYYAYRVFAEYQYAYERGETKLQKLLGSPPGRIL